MCQINDVLGFLAAACVLITFCMRSMRSLRIVALASNVIFIAYAYRSDLLPILALHLLLVPINLAALWRVGRGFEQNESATPGRGLRQAGP